METRFQGQVVLVAGGTGALGSAVSQAFLREGADVFVSYRRSEEYEALKRAAASDGARLRGQQLDVTDEPAMRRTVVAIDTELGRLDALINTVGAYAGGAKLWDVTSAELERMLNLNLRAAFVASRSVMPMLLKQRHGSIVSVAAKAAVDQPGGAGAYVASKAAVLALMHSLAIDAKGTGVRVNTVLPNIIDTAANRRDMPQADFTNWTKVEEIANVILFLCSADARAINGAAIPV